MNNDQKLPIMLSISSKVEWKNAMIISNKLNTTDGRASTPIMMIRLFDNITVILLSIFLGSYGADRFYLRDYGRGITKLLLTFGAYPVLIVGIITLNPAVLVSSSMLLLALGIWKIVDIFLCYKAVKTKNFKKIMDVLEMYPEENKPDRDQYETQDIFTF